MGKQTGKKNKQATEKHPGENDAEASIAKARELKEEGNKLFQRRDHGGAMSKYEKALRLLPNSHADVSYLRSNLAACFMQMGLSAYPDAIRECSHALEVTPGYEKALLKRARCYEGMNRLDLALKDVAQVLSVEPRNVMALEVSERVKLALELKGLTVNDNADIELPQDYVEPDQSPATVDGEKKTKKKMKKKTKEKGLVEDKAVVEEVISSVCVKEEAKRNVKLVWGEDIRWVELPMNCSLIDLKEAALDRFPSSLTVRIKYVDREGDLVTITSDAELRSAEEESLESRGSIRFHIFEVELERESEGGSSQLCAAENALSPSPAPCCVEDWVIEFARMFETQVGSGPETHKLYSEAVEETLTGEEAQPLFDSAAEKFQELAALALLNSGSVQISIARKKSSKRGYLKAAERFEEAIATKPDLHEAYLALGQSQFERARLASVPSEEILRLYDEAGKNIEKGTKIWEEGETGSATRSWIDLLWGTVMYERSMVEFRLGLSSWKECLKVSVEKFGLAGAGPNDSAVMLKNHCSNDTAAEGQGLGFKRWNEMYEAKKLQSGVPSFRLENLLRRRVSRNSAMP